MNKEYNWHVWNEILKQEKIIKTPTPEPPLLASFEIPIGWTYDEPKPDPVNHPNHYKIGGIEVIDFLEAKLGEGFEDYCVGNILKYLTRYKHKNGLEDLKKAKWYLEKVITWKDQRIPAKTE